MDQSSPKFSSPIASQKRWTKRNKRKCSFGSIEKRDRRQLNQEKNRAQENRLAADFENSFDIECDFSSPINWADAVENEEKVIYTENARRKYSSSQRPKKHLEMKRERSIEKPMPRKNLPPGTRSALQPVLTDPHRISQRQKQIDMGKNTLGYEMFTKYVSREERIKDDPQTPDKYQQCSTRSWQGQVKIWRRQLHMWDPQDASDASADPFSVSTSFQSDCNDIGVVPLPISSESSQASDCNSAPTDDIFDNDVFGYFSSGRPIQLFDPEDM
ncbi:histone RNA hairpin-binding protein-like [Rhopilema esculentum]|uniref:histone RNA hairpin-binding protein-like n=1 Tax=Rhopilema esculentum TaxID=499914 RepID=UPI0031D48A88